jgi:hypothetical protein
MDYKPKCKHGKRGESDRLKIFKNKLSLPTTLLINTQSMRGKAGELDDRVPDSEVRPAGFTLVSADHDSDLYRETSR